MIVVDKMQIEGVLSAACGTSHETYQKVHPPYALLGTRFSIPRNCHLSLITAWLPPVTWRGANGKREA
jgi:hypothetical protein